MDFLRNCLILITLTAICSILSGCNGMGGGDQPDLGLVKGTVSFDGEPLAGASISFYPDTGRTASAITDSNGSYELFYIRDTPGCKIGHNKVIISSIVDGGGDEGDENEASSPEAEIVPEKYNTSTELEANVIAGENTFDFNLDT